MTFKYKCPTEMGYKKFNISREKHNEIIPYRKRNVFTKVEAFHNEHQVKFHYSTNVLGKIVLTLLLPYSLIMNGFSSFKKIGEEYYNLFHEKEKGEFVEEVVNKTTYKGERNEVFDSLSRFF